MLVRSDPLRVLHLAPAAIDHPQRARPRELRGPIVLLKHTAATPVHLPRCHADRGPWHPGRPDPSPEHCPGCGSPVRIDPAGSAEPDWLVGTCTAPQCGEVVVYRVVSGVSSSPTGASRHLAAEARSP